MRRVLFIISLFFVAGLAVFAEDDPGMSHKVMSDRTLIAAGLGAEKIMLGMSEGDVLKAYTLSDYTVSRPGKSEMFKQVLKVETDMGIHFDRVLYFAAEKFAVFISRGKVRAITGFSLNRVTPEGVSLDRGVDYFVYSYGNKGLKVLNRGSNLLYLYESLGICIADDDADGDIDMYVIFDKKAQ